MDLTTTKPSMKRKRNVEKNQQAENNQSKCRNKKKEKTELELALEEAKADTAGLMSEVVVSQSSSEPVLASSTTQS